MLRIPKSRPSVTLVLVAVSMLACAVPETPMTTIALNQTLVFEDDAGRRFQLLPGSYTVTAEGVDSLRLTVVAGGPSHTLAAESGKHDEELSAPLALSVQDEESPVHHVVLVQPGGMFLDAMGTPGGVLARGTPRKRLSKDRIREQVVAKQNALVRQAER